jgi:hypothetical protein
MDMIMTELAAALPVDIMPGPDDPANVSLPQQPLHQCLFPGACVCSEDGREGLARHWRVVLRKGRELYKWTVPWGYVTVARKADGVAELQRLQGAEMAGAWRFLLL